MQEITVQYFASLREQTGVASETVRSDGIRDIAELKTFLVAKSRPVGSMLCSVNLEHAHDETPVKDGDNIAFFPAVTGG